MNKLNVVVKVHVPYIRYVSPTKVLIGKDWFSAVLCNTKMLPERPPVTADSAVLSLPSYVAREL